MGKRLQGVFLHIVQCYNRLNMPQILRKCHFPEVSWDSEATRCTHSTQVRVWFAARSKLFANTSLPNFAGIGGASGSRHFTPEKWGDWCGLCAHYNLSKTWDFSTPWRRPGVEMGKGCLVCLLVTQLCNMTREGTKAFVLSNWLLLWFV